jgi:hypothetical protein
LNMQHFQYFQFNNQTELRVQLMEHAFAHLPFQHKEF